MNAVVYDLELVKRFKKGQLSEIVEIGACKIDIKQKKVIGSFQVYILPKSGYIAKSTRKFINMPKEDVKKAVPFHTGIQLFSKWLGRNYYLCSWGKDDKVHLVNQCLRTKVTLDWFVNYNDIQEQIGNILRKGDRNQLGLKSALDLAGIKPIGKAHRGVDDAINTAELLIKYIDQVQLQMNTITENELKQYQLNRKKYHLKRKKITLSKS